MSEKKEEIKEPKKTKSLKEKLLDLKSKVAIMKEDGNGYGYTYVTEESILLQINDEMTKNKLKLTPSIVPGTLHTETITYTNSKGKQVTDVLVTAEMKFTWEDIKSGEKETIDWLLVGQQDDASKAFGGGLTYANRYFLTKYFNIATSKDDPDAIRSKMEAEEEAKAKRKLTATQTKIKKLFATLVQIYQGKNKVYEILGTTKEQFMKDYEDETKADTLLEQLELIKKGDVDVKS